LPCQKQTPWPSRRGWNSLLCRVCKRQEEHGRELRADHQEKKEDRS
jgi:hypothetical protein